MRPRRDLLESDDILAKDKHTICLGDYLDETNATETIDRFWEIYQDGRIKTPEDILTHIDSSRDQDMTAPSLAIGQGVGRLAA